MFSKFKNMIVDLWMRFKCWISELVSGFWTKHISGVFPYPDECFDCREGSCMGCPTHDMIK